MEVWPKLFSVHLRLTLQFIDPVFVVPMSHDLHPEYTPLEFWQPLKIFLAWEYGWECNVPSWILLRTFDELQKRTIIWERNMSVPVGILFWKFSWLPFRRNTERLSLILLTPWAVWRGNWILYDGNINWRFLVIPCGVSW